MCPARAAQVLQVAGGLDLRSDLTQHFLSSICISILADGWTREKNVPWLNRWKQKINVSDKVNINRAHTHAHTKTNIAAETTNITQFVNKTTKTQTSLVTINTDQLQNIASEWKKTRTTQPWKSIKHYNCKTSLANAQNYKTHPPDLSFTVGEDSTPTIGTEPCSMNWVITAPLDGIQSHSPHAQSNLGLDLSCHSNQYGPSDDLLAPLRSFFVAAMKKQLSSKIHLIEK